MEKKDARYYEDRYIDLINELKAANSPADSEKAKDKIDEYRKNGLYQSWACFDGKASAEEYAESRNNKNYNTFARKNNKYMSALVDGERTTTQEINRIKNKQTFRKFRKVVLVGVCVAGLAFGVARCSKNNKKVSATNTTETTIENTNPGTTETFATSYETTSMPSVTTGFSNGYDADGAIASMSDSMSGIGIGGTTTESTAGSYVPSPERNTDPTTAAPTTEPTTSRNTEPTTVAPTNTVAPTTEPTTSRNTEPSTTIEPDEPVYTYESTEVPGTEPIIPTNPNEDEQRNMQDVTIDEYDNVQPSYIDEGSNPTYETYFDIDSTSTAAPTATPTAVPTATATPAPTYAEMPIEEDPNATYETFFQIDENGYVVDNKTLTLTRK